MYQGKGRIQLGSSGSMQLYAALCGVSGNVSWFIGDLYLPKTRQMHRFTSVKGSFHLTCKFLGTTSAFWSDHFKSKAPALDSEPKCVGMTSYAPVSKNILAFLGTAILHQRGL